MVVPCLFTSPLKRGDIMKWSSFFLIGLISLTLSFSVLADERCENSQLKEGCDLIEVGDECSSNLKRVCCACQAEWSTSLPFCGFRREYFPPAVVTEVPTSVPTITRTPPPTTPPTQIPTITPTPTRPTNPQFVCSNGIDDDGDGVSDYLADPGCESWEDQTECGPDRPECDNCIDDDGDGQIDMADENCLDGSDPTEGEEPPTECKRLPMVDKKKDLRMPFRRMVNLAEKSFRHLKRSPRYTADPKLKKRLKRSVKRLRQLIEDYSEQAKVALKQIPNVMIECPTDTPYCFRVDNREALAQYVGAISQLGHRSLKSINRGTRMVYSLTRARRLTKPIGKRVKRAKKDLIKQGQSVPKTRSQCF